MSPLTEDWGWSSPGVSGYLLIMASDGKSPVWWASGSDPEMLEASERARETFRYFWREMTWEARRIIKGCDLAAVKAPFADTDDPAPDDPVEHMWVADVGFDGCTVTGVLLNEPNWLKTLHAESEVELPLERISDWMYAQRGRVYGAYTVNLLRGRMPAPERMQHDDAWGLDFGDPGDIELVPPVSAPRKQGFFSKMFSPQAPPAPGDPESEHPMCLNMVAAYRDQLQQDASPVHVLDELGWTQVHVHALGGNAPIVELLLEFGADAEARTPDGRTARDLATSLGWANVIAALDGA
ncbi:MAG: DUF2314 domain-containing protein [Sandaracinaceae bacterium]